MISSEVLGSNFKDTKSIYNFFYPISLKIGNERTVVVYTEGHNDLFNICKQLFCFSPINIIVNCDTHWLLYIYYL